MERLQSYVRSGGTDNVSFSEAYRLLDVSSYGFYSASSWGMVYQAQQQMRRVLRNIMRRVRPYAKKEKQNIRQMEQLFIPIIKRLLPLLINSDIYSIEAWNEATVAQWPVEAPSTLTLNRIRGLFSSLWIRLIVAGFGAIIPLALGSLIEGADFFAYFKQNYPFFWTVLIGFEAVVVAHAGLTQRGEKEGRTASN